MKIYRTIDNFLNWWISGLLILLPQNLREKIRRTPDHLLLDLDKGTLTLNLVHGISNTLLQTRCLDKDDTLELIALTEWLNKLQNNNTEIILLVPEDKVLIKSLALPAGAKDDVREILSFEMDRQTPFTTDQVYFDYLLLNSATNNEKIQVELFVASKKIINHLLSELSNWRIRAQRATLKRDNQLLEQLNFLPANLQDSTLKKANIFTRVLIACSFLLFIAALYLPLPGREQSLAALEAEVAKSKAQAKELLALTMERKNILSRSRFLIEKQNSRIPAIEIVNELTRILPDDTWLNRLVIRDNKVELQGESSAATAIIQLIEDSDYFRDAQFRSPITHSNATDKDKFNVSAMISKGDNS